MDAQMKMKLFLEVFISNRFNASREAVRRIICGLCTVLMTSGVTKGFTSFALNVFDELTKPNSGTINIVIRTVISRLLVQDVLSVSLSYARLRPRGMLVIACRGYLSVFRPKSFIWSCSPSILTQGQNLSSVPHTLEAQLSLPLHHFNPSKLEKDHVAC